MSDHWEFYFCRIEEKIASIFLDVGLRSVVPIDGAEALVRVEVELQDPRDDGLTSSEEFADLRKLEQVLEACAETHHGLYVGRITWNGLRIFYIYAADPEPLMEALAETVRGVDDYTCVISCEADPDFETYTDTLYPTKVDWQTIQNRRVLEALEQRGDDCTALRRIDHWFYFDDEENRRSFRDVLEHRGYHVADESMTGDDPPRYGLRVWHDEAPGFARINELTVDLLLHAEEFDGEYDGWETEIVADEA